MFRFACLLTVFTLAPLLSGCGGPEDASPILKFSGIRDQDTTRLAERFGPVAAWLSERLGVPVEYVPTTDYGASVEAFTNGDIQLAWFGGLTGAQARHRVPGARAIAQGKEDPEFYSYFIAHRDTGIERSDEFPAALAGLSFTFGSESSTSGRLMPEHFIVENTGKTPNEFFSSVAFSGDHDKTVELVETGAVEVGAVNYKVYRRRVAEEQTDESVCRIVWKTPSYPDYNFTAHPVLEEMFGEGFIDKLQSALVAIDDEELLAAFPRERLIPATNEDFEPVRKLAERLGFLNR